MKSKPDELRPLLDEVLPVDEGTSGPDCAEVLGMVRVERTKRTQRRLAGAAMALVAVLFVFSFSQRNPMPSPAVQITATVSPPPPATTIERINDDELLTLLQDTPSALLEWPNGERTLLIVEHR